MVNRLSWSGMFQTNGTRNKTSALEPPCYRLPMVETKNKHYMHAWTKYCMCYHPEAAKIVNLHFPLIYIFARIYIPNLRKLKGKCKFYIFPKNVFFRRKIEDLCKNENFHFFLHTKNYYFVSISLVSSLDF